MLEFMSALNHCAGAAPEREIDFQIEAGAKLPLQFTPLQLANEYEPPSNVEDQLQAKAAQPLRMQRV
jgi:hypothetical protein